MPRQVTDSISFVVQAEFKGHNNVDDDSGLRFSSANLIESSNLYGILFIGQGNFLYITSVVKAEEEYDSASNLSDISFRIEFPSDITSLSLSSSDSYLAVTAGDILSVISVINVLIKVCTSCQVDGILSERLPLSEMLILLTFYHVHFLQKSKADSIVKTIPLDLSADHSRKYQAIWCSSVDNEQIALLLPDCIQFVDPSPQLSPKIFPRINAIYSCITCSPTTNLKSKTILAARENCIDAIDVATGKVLVSFDNMIESDDPDSRKLFYSQNFSPKLWRKC